MRPGLDATAKFPGDRGVSTAGGFPFWLSPPNLTLSSIKNNSTSGVATQDHLNALQAKGAGSVDALEENVLDERGRKVNQSDDQSVPGRFSWMRELRTVLPSLDFHHVLYPHQIQP